MPPGIGADTFLLKDDLETQSGWDVVDAPTGHVEYGDGTLEMSFDVVGSIWSDRELEARWNVLRVEGVVYLKDAAGAAGLMCGSGALDHVGGVVNTKGDWFVVETVGGDTQQLTERCLADGESDGRLSPRGRVCGYRDGRAALANARRWRCGAHVRAFHRPG